MSIDRLKALVPPPQSPTETGSVEQWEQIQQKLGIRLPDDFREFGMTYGSGSIADLGRLDIFVYQPFSQKFLEMVDFHSCNLDAFRVGEGEDYIPYKIFPEASGLLVWGGDVDGNELYWKTFGEPNAWPIVVRSRDNDYQEFPGPLTDFLAAALTRKHAVRIWPKPLFLDPGNIRFDPDPEPEQNPVWPETIYVLYTQNGNRTGFWVRSITSPGVSYFIKSIGGMAAGPISGIPQEYDRQPVVADLYLGDKLFESDSSVGHAYQMIFVKADPPI